MSVCPTAPVCILTHKNDHVCTLKNPVVHVFFWGVFFWGFSVVHVERSVDYGNTKRPSMPLWDWVVPLLRLL